MLLLLLGHFSYLPKALLNAHHFALDGFLAASFRRSCSRMQEQTKRTRRNWELITREKPKYFIMNVFYLHCAFVWTMEGAAGYFILVVYYNNTFVLPVVSYGLLYQTEYCPSEAVEFICSNTDGPVVV